MDQQEGYKCGCIAFVFVVDLLSQALYSRIGRYKKKEFLYISHWSQ